jgi:ACT domain-containing protein
MRDEMMRYLYPVHLVRHHADELGLSNAQYRKLRDVVTRVKGEVEQLNWDLDREARKLLKLLAAGASREQIYAQMDRVFQFENQIKKKHLGLMISVRDILNRKQRQQLDKIKEEQGFGEGRPGRGNRSGKGRAQGRAAR